MIEPETCIDIIVNHAQFGDRADDIVLLNDTHTINRPFRIAFNYLYVKSLAAQRNSSSQAANATTDNQH